MLYTFRFSSVMSRNVYGYDEDVAVPGLEFCCYQEVYSFFINLGVLVIGL